MKALHRAALVALLFPLPSSAGEAVFDVDAHCRSLRSTSAKALEVEREREGVLTELVLLKDEPERTPLLLELAATRCRIASAIDSADPKGAEKSRSMGSDLFRGILAKSPQHPAVIKLQQAAPRSAPADTSVEGRIATITQGRNDARARLGVYQSAMEPANLADSDFSYACFEWLARPPADESAAEQKNSRDMARKVGKEFLERHRGAEYQWRFVRKWIELYDQSRPDPRTR